jgi:hypothetical protein
MPVINNPIKPFQGDIRATRVGLNQSDIDAERYYEDTQYMTHSMLRKGYRNPEDLALILAGWRQDGDTDAMKLGRHFEMALLEPEKYNSKLLVVDDGDICREIGGARPRSTKRYGEWMAEVEGEAVRTGRTVISLDEHKLHQDMTDRVMRVPHIRELLDNTLRQVVVQGEFDGVAMKGMLDVTDGTDYVLDLKRVHRAKYLQGYDAQNVREYMDRMDIDSQLYLYGELGDVRTRYVLFVDDQYPHTPCLVTLSEEMLRVGKAKMSQFMLEYKLSFNPDTNTLRDPNFSVNLTL